MQPFQNCLIDSFRRENGRFLHYLPLIQDPVLLTGMSAELISGASGEHATDAACAIRIEKTKKKIEILKLEISLMACEQNSAKPMAIIQDPIILTGMRAELISGASDEHATDAARAIRIEKTKSIANLKLEMLMMACEHNSVRPLAIMCDNTCAEEIQEETPIYRQRINVNKPIPAKATKAFSKKQKPKALNATIFPSSFYPILGLEKLRPVDVFLGTKNKRCLRYTGNVAFRAFIDSKLDIYMNSPIPRTIEIDITNSIYAAGGEFFDAEDRDCKALRAVDVKVVLARVRRDLRTGLKKRLTGDRTQFQSATNVPKAATFAEIVDYFVARAAIARTTRNQAQMLKDRVVDA